MSAAQPLLAATTAANTAFPTGGLNATEYDQLVLCVNTNALGAGETVKVYVLDTKGAQQPLQNPTSLTQYQLDNTAPASMAITLPGGYLYQFAKTATAAAVGVDFLPKPRAGASGG